MSDNKKPDYIILLRKAGKHKKKVKNAKLELFNYRLWDDSENYRHRKFRMRINGRWYKRSRDGKKYFTKTEVKEWMFKQIF